MSKAVILLSGGLDSTTLLYYAKSKGFNVYCLIFEYGQRHKKEIERAKKIAQSAKSPQCVVRIRLPWKGSALLDQKIPLPHREIIDPKEIPVTYVPARNIIFLSYAISFAETMGANAIFIGANTVDYSGYPDCRPEFFRAYEEVVKKGLKTGVERRVIKIYTPFIYKTKAQIIKMGLRLKVPYHQTWSCYEGGKIPCGKCDSCVLRRKGFKEAGVKDPIC